MTTLVCPDCGTPYNLHRVVVAEEGLTVYACHTQPSRRGRDLLVLLLIGAAMVAFWTAIGLGIRSLLT